MFMFIILAQLSDDVTYGIIGDNTLTPTLETEVIDETCQGLTQRTPDDVAQTSSYVSFVTGDGFG